MFGGGLSVAGACNEGSAVTSSSPSFCSSDSFKDFLYSFPSWLSPSGCSGTSCHLCARFVLLIVLDLIPATSYAIKSQTVISLATQASLVDCYGLWSFLLFQTTQQHAPSLTWFALSFASHKVATLGKITSLLATCDG